jgi:hypothetical protein
LDGFVDESSNGGRAKLELAGRYTMDNLDDMNSIFLPKDRLLSSAGIFPVYYMFVRDSKGTNYSKIREFISDFEKERRNNRKLVRDEPNSNNVKPFLVRYDNFNRSTDNQQSHKERYQILMDCFCKYLESGEV